jgi:ATP-dependent Clp protease ATP-binding subunit ClpC
VPKINVYLPDELAEAVKDAGVPVSAICQRALEQAGAPDHRHPADGPGRAGGRFSGPAAGVLELTVTEATVLGHNYVGCEHLLLGLITEPDGTAGHVLRALGAEPRLMRRAVTAALAGYVHLRAQTSATAADPAQALADAVHQQIQPLIERVERLEHHLGSAPDTP